MATPISILRPQRYAPTIPCSWMLEHSYTTWRAQTADKHSEIRHNMLRDETERIFGEGSYVMWDLNYSNLQYLWHTCRTSTAGTRHRGRGQHVVVVDDSKDFQQNPSWRMTACSLKTKNEDETCRTATVIKHSVDNMTTTRIDIADRWGIEYTSRHTASRGRDHFLLHEILRVTNWRQDREKVGHICYRWEAVGVIIRIQHFHFIFFIRRKSVNRSSCPVYAMQCEWLLAIRSKFAYRDLTDGRHVMFSLWHNRLLAYQAICIRTTGICTMHSPYPA